MKNKILSIQHWKDFILGFYSICVWTKSAELNGKSAFPFSFWWGTESVNAFSGSACVARKSMVLRTQMKTLLQMLHWKYNAKIRCDDPDEIRFCGIRIFLFYSFFSHTLYHMYELLQTKCNSLKATICCDNGIRASQRSNRQLMESNINCMFEHKPHKQFKFPWKFRAF